MTKRNKLIVGAVVVLGAYYLYDRNKKMKVVSDLKAGADVTKDTPVLPVGGGSVPLEVTEVSTSTISKMGDEEKRQLNFAGGRGKSMSAQYFR